MGYVCSHASILLNDGHPCVMLYINRSITGWVGTCKLHDVAVAEAACLVENAYNEEMLRRTVTEYNTLVVIKYKDEASSNNNRFMSRHLNNTYDMRKTMMCRAAMVELSKTHIVPKWVLYTL
jgi:hypothetical protein